jgi:hypothetical protein
MHDTCRRRPSRTLGATASACIATLLALPAHASWLTDPCTGCEFTAGLGKTFHNTELTGTVVPAAFTWGGNRYEFALYYFSKQYLGQEYQNRVIAPQDWALSIARRLRLWHHGPWEAFAGLGLSYRTGDPCPNPAKTDPSTFANRNCNRLNGSQQNFTLQLGGRWWEADHGAAIEIALRHFSNAGLKPPNVGQDFLTLSYVF